MTHIGSGFPLELKRDYRESRDGTQLIQRWKVATAAVASWIATLQAAGYTDIDAQGIEGTPFHIVSATVVDDLGETAILSDVWSVAYNEVQRSIWALPTIKAELAKTDGETAALWRADVDAIVAGNRTYLDTDGTNAELTFAGLRAVAVAWGASGTVIDKLFTSLGNGVDTYIVSLPVLRRRTIMPSTTTLQPAFENVGSVYETASMIFAEPSMPANIENAITANFADGYWLKKAPSADQQDDGRWVYLSEYWYAEEETPDPLIYPIVL